MKKRTSLTCKNDKTADIDDLLLEGFTVTYRLVDSVVEVDDSVNYNVDFMHTLNPPGIPQHCVPLKVGTPVMLLRKVNLPEPASYRSGFVSGFKSKCSINT